MYICSQRASQVTLAVKNPPANAGDVRDQVQFLGQEDPQKRAWQCIPVFLSGESHGQRSQVGYWTCLKQLSMHAYSQSLGALYLAHSIYEKYLAHNLLSRASPTIRKKKKTSDLYPK